jgi:hypothetical protein
LSVKEDSGAGPNLWYSILFAPIGKQEVELIVFLGKLEGSDGIKDGHTSS